MIYKRKLKNIEFTYDTDSKLFTVTKADNISVAVSGVGKATVAGFTRAEAGAFSRFIFSMFQYYSHTKKKKAVKE